MLCTDTNISLRAFRAGCSVCLLAARVTVWIDGNIGNAVFEALEAVTFDSEEAVAAASPAEVLGDAASAADPTVGTAAVDAAVDAADEAVLSCCPKMFSRPEALKRSLNFFLRALSRSPCWSRFSSSCSSCERLL